MHQKWNVKNYTKFNLGGIWGDTISWNKLTVSAGSNVYSFSTCLAGVLRVT